MLVAALAATVLGFVLLVVAVLSGDVAWAWGCIGIGVAGLLLLLGDLVGNRRPEGEADPVGTRTHHARRFRQG